MMITKVKVIKVHHSDVLIPFQAQKGEIVKGKEKTTQWEGWFYCKNKGGIFGWVPKAFVTPVKYSSEEFQFVRAYNAFEISASEGEFVIIKEIESGKIGWIPLENLDNIEL